MSSSQDLPVTGGSAAVTLSIAGLAILIGGILRYFSRLGARQRMN